MQRLSHSPVTAVTRVQIPPRALIFYPKMTEMKEKEIVIEINCTASKIFKFTLNPANTHLWIDSIVREETNESPTKLGTEYRNLNKQGKWAVYEITRFEPYRMFEMKQKGNSYHVRYIFGPLPDNKTKLTYFEWVDNGELEEPLSPAILEKLKEIVENQPRE